MYYVHLYVVLHVKYMHLLSECIFQRTVAVYLIPEIRYIITGTLVNNKDPGLNKINRVFAADLDKKISRV